MDKTTNNIQAGYKYLLTYQYSCVIYDQTTEFCQKFLLGRELLRQRDQMIQAARSGKQNITEGYELQSLETYIKFLGIAKGSIKELQEDYEDFLRQRNFRLWDKDEPKMRDLRDLRVVREPYPHIPQIPHIPQDPEPAANFLFMLCQRTTYLLEKQIESLKEKFIKEGGFRENLFRQRLKYKKEK
ncbi:four helix bundle protein [Candidatus Gottesmanbacteria bacterium]|nr:four helix bundle protein [Candidatus Gottesmanbacteria bacterium]MBI5465649.1 four helix bundle protein [Candidatus Gottesmanbacteria bacterium]